AVVAVAVVTVVAVTAAVVAVAVVTVVAVTTAVVAVAVVAVVAVTAAVVAVAMVAVVAIAVVVAGLAHDAPAHGRRSSYATLGDADHARGARTLGHEGRRGRDEGEYAERAGCRLCDGAMLRRDHWRDSLRSRVRDFGSPAASSRPVALRPRVTPG